MAIIVRDDGDRLWSDREKRRNEGLARLRAHFAGVLKTVCAFMSTCFKRNDAKAPSRAPLRIAKAISARLRRSIVVSAGISARTCLISSKRGDVLFPPRGRHAHILFGRREIIGVVGVQGRAKAGLARKPKEKVAQVLERRSDGRHAQWLAAGAGFLAEPSAKGASLFDAEFAKRLAVGGKFKALDRAQSGVDCSALLAVHRLQKEGIVALTRSFSEQYFDMGFHPSSECGLELGSGVSLRRESAHLIETFKSPADARSVASDARLFIVAAHSGQSPLRFRALARPAKIRLRQRRAFSPLCSESKTCGPARKAAFGRLRGA